jgi:hypothetical protein
VVLFMCAKYTTDCIIHLFSVVGMCISNSICYNCSICYLWIISDGTQFDFVYVMELNLYLFIYSRM